MKLFRNTKFEVKMVDDKPSNDWEGVLNAQSPGVTFNMSPEQVSAAATEFIGRNTETIVTGIVTVMAARTALNIVQMSVKYILR